MRFHGAAVALIHEEVVGRLDIHVHARHDEVGRMVPVVELHHVFTEVGLVDLDAVVQEGVVAVDLLGDHALALDDALGAFGVADVEKDALGVFGGVGEMHDVAIGSGLLDELRQVIV